MSDFFADRDLRGKPLELLAADHFHKLNIPFGFNPHSETDNPHREDFDLYTGQPEAPLLWEFKMDWLSAITGNVFVEEKALRNTLAHKIAVARLFIDVFDADRLRQLYEAKNRVRRADGGFSEQYLYKHLVGGDQANNIGMLLDWKTVKANSEPFWLVSKQLRERQ
jgi:hypothetical protein